MRIFDGAALVMRPRLSDVHIYSVNHLQTVPQEFPNSL